MINFLLTYCSGIKIFVSAFLNGMTMVLEHLEKTFNETKIEIDNIIDQMHVNDPNDVIKEVNSKIDNLLEGIFLTNWYISSLAYGISIGKLNYTNETELT